ncbi:MAG: hypothetical protein RSB22_14205 [Acinetobacter sp.]
MTKDIERAAFEATQNTKVLFESIEYIESTDAYVPKNGFGHSLVVSSLAERLNFGWSMWKAATKRAEEKLKGCVVVPVEPSMSMVYAAVSTDDFNEHEYVVAVYKAMVEAARSGNE